jgi:CheY-specific phosphatase CheX
MKITSDDLSQFTRTIWETTLSLNIRPIPCSQISKPDADAVECRVQVTGAWLGTVLLQCSEELGKKAARIMFGLGAEDPAAEEIRDALAEITNITAGNFKSLLSAQCSLSLPQVTRGVLEPGAAFSEVVIYRQAFDCGHEPFLITILQQDASPGHGAQSKDPHAA